MEIEEQVCSFEQAKKLFSLGVNLPSLLFWMESGEQPDGSAAPKLILSTDVDKEDGFVAYPALTVAELGILLPPEINDEDEDLYLQGTIGNRRGEFYYIWFQSAIDNVEWDLFPAIEQDTEAGARAEALIWLIENDYVKVTDLRL